MNPSVYKTCEFPEKVLYNCGDVEFFLKGLFFNCRTL